MDNQDKIEIITKVAVLEEKLDIFITLWKDTWKEWRTEHLSLHKDINSRIRENEAMRWKLIGMAIVASAIVSILVILITSKL